MITPIFSYHVLEVRTFWGGFDLGSMSHQTCNLPQRKQDIFLIKKSISKMSASSMFKKNSGGIMRSCFLNYNSSRWDVMPSRIMRLGSWLPWLVGSFWISLAEFIIPKTPKTKHRPKRKKTHVFQHLPASQLSGVFAAMAWFKSMQWISNSIYSIQWRSFRTFYGTYHTRSL